MMDIVLLYLLHEKINFGLVLSTTIAYWTSITYNFIMNRWWTFGAQDTAKIYKHAAAYLFLLGFNYLFTVTFVWGASHFIHYGIAKIAAVGMSICWTYPIYKYVVFKSDVKDN